MPGMDGFITFNGTLQGGIEGGGGGDVTDVKVRDSQETTFESVVNEEGVAEIDLISYVRRNELTQAIENVENSIDNVEQLVDTKQNIINNSTDEQVVGTWFGKPLYQKTIFFSVISSGYQSVKHGIQNIEKIWVDFADSFIAIDAATGETIGVCPYRSSQVSDVFEMIVDVYTTLDYKAGSALNEKTAYITLRYTKTTD